MKYKIQNVKLLFLPIVLATMSVAAQTVDFNNYQPLRSSGPLPADVTTLASVQYQKEVEKMNAKNTNYGKKIDKKVKKDFLLRTSFAINTLLLSGRVLYNDPVGDYVRQVADLVLENDPELKKKIRIYILKTDEVNAFATHQGMVFVTIGLLAQLNNEAELAFILAHEFIHVKKEHVISDYVEKRKIENRQGKYYDVDNFDDAIAASSQFSRDQESEADLEGFKLFKKTKYAHSSVNGVFDVLEYSYLPFDEVAFSPAMFETQHLKFPKKFILADSLVKNAESISEKRKKSRYDDDDPKTEKEGEDDEADEDGTINTSTHPEIPERRKALEAKFEEDDDKTKKLYLVSENEFTEMRKMCRYELCRIYMVDQEFEKALYSTYILLRSNPSSVYLNRISAHALYALSRHLNGDGRYTFKEVHHRYKGSEGFISQLYYFTEKLSRDKAAFSAVTLAYLLKLHKSFPDDVEIARMASQIMWDLVSQNKMKRDDFANEVAAAKKKDETIEAVTEGEETKYDKIKKKKKKEKEKSAKNSFHKLAFIEFALNEEFNDSFAACEKRYKAQEDEESLAETEKRALRKKEEKERKQKEKNGLALGINKIVLLDPDFTQVDMRDSKNPVKLQAGEARMKDLEARIANVASLLNLQMVKLNGKSLKNTEAEKLNDIAVLGDWIKEYYRADGLSMVTTGMPQVRELIEKYGTRYLCLVDVKLVHLEKENLIEWYCYSLGFPPLIFYAIYNSLKPNIHTIFRVYVVDLETGQVNMEVNRNIKTKATGYMLNSHLYDIFSQIKHSRK